MEDYLNSFTGIVITVSHDRYFLDNVVDRIFELDGNGGIRQFEGGYTDYVRRRNADSERKAKDITGKSELKNSERSPQKRRRRRKEKTGRTDSAEKVKFSFKEQREYETIDEEIAKLEEKLRLLIVRLPQMQRIQ